MLNRLPPYLYYLLAVVPVVTASSASATEWHVSPSGQDTAAGTGTAPFLTIARALLAAGAGDSIVLHTGVYRETIQPLKDGAADAPITLRNAPGEKPVVSALDRVPGPWTSDGPGTFKTTPPTSNLDATLTAGAQTTGLDQVFVDGQAQPEARHPNRTSTGSFQTDGATVTCTATQVKGAAFAGKPTSYFVGARFLGQVGVNWTAQSAVVAASDGDTMTVTGMSGPWWPDATFTDGGGTGYVFGKRELLDADGEWFIARASGGPEVLYLQTPAGRNPSGFLIERKTREYTLLAQTRKHWRFVGLSLVGGAVKLDGGDLVLQDTQVTHASHFQAFAGGYSPNGGKTSGSAVSLSGTGNTVTGCTISDSSGSGVQTLGSGHTITRNLITDVDTVGTYGEGISAMGQNQTVEFNTLRNAGRDAIGLAGGGHRIAYNDLSQYGQLTLDLGGVYTIDSDGQAPDGTLTRIDHNWIHDTANRATYLTNGIYLDARSRNVQLDHNVIWNIGDPTRSWGSRGVVVNSPGYGISVLHNTLFDCNDRSYTGNFSNPKNYPWGSTLVVRDLNNLFIPKATPVTQVLTDPAHDDFVPLAAYADPALSTSHTVTPYSGDAGKTFDITLGHGVVLPGVNDDAVGATPDDGAYERGLPAWKPGVDGYLSGDAPSDGGTPLDGSVVLDGSADATAPEETDGAAWGADAAAPVRPPPVDASVAAHDAGVGTGANDETASNPISGGCSCDLGRQGSLGWMGLAPMLLALMGWRRGSQGARTRLCSRMPGPGTTTKRRSWGGYRGWTWSMWAGTTAGSRRT